MHGLLRRRTGYSGAAGQFTGPTKGIEHTEALPDGVTPAKPKKDPKYIDPLTRQYLEVLEFHRLHALDGLVHDDDERDRRAEQYRKYFKKCNRQYIVKDYDYMVATARLKFIEWKFPEDPPPYTPQQFLYLWPDYNPLDFKYRRNTAKTLDLASTSKKRPALTPRPSSPIGPDVDASPAAADPMPVEGAPQAGGIPAREPEVGGSVADSEMLDIEVIKAEDPVPQISEQEDAHPVSTAEDDQTPNETTSANETTSGANADALPIDQVPENADDAAASGTGAKGKTKKGARKRKLSNPLPSVEPARNQPSRSAKRNKSYNEPTLD